MGEAVSIDLGCGQNSTPGSFGLDQVLLKGSVDIVADLERPLPLRGSCVQTIYMHDVLEHVADVPSVLREVHRVLIPGGVLDITLPHYSHPRTYADPTHRHFFSYRTVEYLAGNSYEYYGGGRFEIQRAILGQPGRETRFRRLLNRYPYQVERILSSTVGIRSMYFELSAVK